MENLLSCSTLINNSKEKQALEKGGYKDLQVHRVPPNCARYNSCKIKQEEGNLNQTKETVRKKTLLKLVRHKERKKTHQKEEGGSQSRAGKGEK